MLDDICHRIKKFRGESGYTQQQISNLLNIDRSTYSYYEAGKTIPDLKTLIKLAEIFNQPLMHLLESENKNSMSLSDSEKYQHAYVDTESENDNLWKQCRVPKKIDIKEAKKEVKNVNKISKIKKELLKYPKFSSDLSSEEKHIIMCFRMLPVRAQKEIVKIMEQKMKSESLFD